MPSPKFSVLPKGQLSPGNPFQDWVLPAPPAPGRRRPRKLSRSPARKRLRPSYAILPKGQLSPANPFQKFVVTD